MQKPERFLKRAAVRIALTYLLFAGIWILASDWLLLHLLDDPRLITKLQVLKGWGFVAVTAGLLYTAIRTYIYRYQVAEQRVREREAEYHQLVENLNDGLAAVDGNGVLTFINTRFCQMLDRCNEELTGKPITAYMDGENADIFNQHITGKQPRARQKFELEWQGDRRVIPSLISAQALFDESDTYQGSVIIVTDISVQKHNEERILHLNTVLRAIREVNQLIVMVHDRATLVRRMCETLVETRGSANAWVILIDNQGNYTMSAEAGIGDEFDLLIDTVKTGTWPGFWREALDIHGVRIVAEGDLAESNCPILNAYKGLSVMSRRIEHEGVVYGLLTIASKEKYADDPEEQKLFEEVCGDLAYALHGISVAEEKAQAVQALTTSEQRLNAVIENTTALIYVKDLEGRFLLVNRATEAAMGMPKQEIIGKNDFDIFPKEDAEKYRENDSLVARTGVPYQFEERYHTPDGEERVNLSLKVPMRDSEGNIYAVCGISTDITERSRAEQLLRNSERRLADIINFLPNATFVIDRNGAVVTWNKAIEDISGIPAADMNGKGDYEYAIPFYGQRRPMLIDIALHPEIDIGEYYPGARRDNDTLIAEAYIHSFRPGGAWFWAKARPLYDSDGNIIGAIESIREVTAEKKAAKAIEDLAKIPRENPFPLMRLSAAGTVLYANESAEPLLQAWETEQGRPMPRKWRQVVRDVMKNQVARSQFVTHDAQAYDLVVVPVEGADYVNVYGHDVTELRHIEDALRQQQEEYEIIFNSVPAYIWYKDLDSRIIRANLLAGEAMGITLEEAVGKTTQELYPEHGERYVAYDREVLESGKPQYGIIEPLVLANGEERLIRTDKIPYRDEHGRICGLIVFSVDITDVVQRENVKEKARSGR